MKLNSKQDFALRTICQTHRELYRALVRDGYAERSEVMQLLRASYRMGKKMGARLRQFHNDYDDGWYERVQHEGPDIDAGDEALWMEKLDAKANPKAGHAEAVIAAANALGIKVRAMAEVGVYKGHASDMFRLLLPDADLVLVDPWASVDESKIAATNTPESWEAIYADVLKRHGDNPKTTILRKTSVKAARELRREFDVVFLDACHRRDAVAADINAWLPHVRRPGLICGHDYHRKRAVNRGVRRAVNAAFGKEVWAGPDATWFHYLED